MKKLLVAAVAAGLLAIGLSTQVASAQDINVCTGSGPVTVCTGYESIQKAIDAAPDNAVIVIPSGERTEANIKIEDKALTIRGTSPRETIVQAASYPCAVPGRVFQISSARVTIEDLTIRHGCVLSPTLPSVGGGIWNAGTLTLRRVIVADNIIRFADEVAEGARPWTPRGGGIYSVGSLEIYDSTIVNNSVSSVAGAALGGGLYNNGRAAIANSTISDNTSLGLLSGDQTLTGGGIYNAGTLAMEYNTVVKNVAVDGGGAISSTGDLELINNLFYANQPPGSEVECAPQAARTSDGAAPLSDTGVESAGVPAVANEQCDTPVLGQVELGDLSQDTWTPVYIPEHGSDSIDAGTCAQSKITMDQRGGSRAQGNECDLGSVELGFSYMPVLVSSPPMPDLIVRQVTIEPAGPLDSGTQATIRVVIENIGNKATDGGFYVDLFINPRETPPNHAGLTWADLCRTDRCRDDKGIVWLAPPTIYPKEQWVFTSNIDVDEYAVRKSSKWDKYFPVGEVKIWVFVDSYEATRSPQGYIAERREDNNRYEAPLFTVTPGRIPDAMRSADEPAGDPFAPRPRP